MGAHPFPGDAPVDPSADDEQELEALRDALSRFGTWVDDPERGTVWFPNPKEVGKDFAPYKSGGRWGIDKAGDWNWISDYAWGDIPFHFGNWTWVPPPAELPSVPNALPSVPGASGAPKAPQAPTAPSVPSGWAWVPGLEYAPAWVVWRLGDAKHPFLGWAPMPPSQRFSNGKLAPYKSEQVLPFFYVPADKLFDPAVARRVVTDRKLGRTMHQSTRTFAGSLGPCAPSVVKAKAKAATSKGAKDLCQGAFDQLWAPASPTLKQAGIAAALMADPPATPHSLSEALRALPGAKKTDKKKQPSKVDAKKSEPPKVDPKTLKVDPKKGDVKAPGTESRLDDANPGDNAGDEVTTERGKHYVRRCVRTQRHGMRCWTYRWPPLWRGRR